MGEEGEWREEEGEGVEWRVEYAGYGRCCQGVEAVEVMTVIAIADSFHSPPSACRLVSFHDLLYPTILYNILIIHVFLSCTIFVSLLELYIKLYFI